MVHLGKFKGQNNKPYIAPDFGIGHMLFIASVVFIAAFAFGSML